MEIKSNPREANSGERGATMVEYALLVALLCVVAVGGVRAVGVGVKNAMLSAQRPLVGSGGVTEANAPDGG